MDIETKQMFELMMKKLDGIDQKLDGVDQRLNGMEQRLDRVDQRLDRVEIRQDEIFSIVKAIEHSNNIHKAEIDNITYKVARTEGIINKIGDVIIESRAV